MSLNDAVTLRLLRSSFKGIKQAKKNAGETRANQGGLADGLTARGDAALNLRKHSIGAAPNQTDRANYDNQDYSQHHCIFSDVLTALLRPNLPDSFNHFFAPHQQRVPGSYTLSGQWFAVV